MRPVVSRVVAREVLDASASVAVQVELHCIVNGVEKVRYCERLSSLAPMVELSLFLEWHTCVVTHVV